LAKSAGDVEAASVAVRSARTLSKPNNATTAGFEVFELTDGGSDGKLFSPSLTRRGNVRVAISGGRLTAVRVDCRTVVSLLSEEGGFNCPSSTPAAASLATQGEGEEEEDNGDGGDDEDAAACEDTRGLPISVSSLSCPPLSLAELTAFTTSRKGLRNIAKEYEAKKALLALAEAAVRAGAVATKSWTCASSAFAKSCADQRGKAR
jgi:hypothetical protein